MVQKCEPHLLKSVKNFQENENNLVKINNKLLTNENDVFVPNENKQIVEKLLQENQTKHFFFMLIGSKKWKVLNDILAPFGEKWKAKIMGTVSH